MHIFLSFCLKVVLWLKVVLEKRKIKVTKLKELISDQVMVLEIVALERSHVWNTLGWKEHSMSIEIVMLKN
jgi:hypothetical protein